MLRINKSLDVPFCLSELCLVRYAEGMEEETLPPICPSTQHPCEATREAISARVRAAVTQAVAEERKKAEASNAQAKDRAKIFSYFIAMLASVLIASQVSYYNYQKGEDVPQWMFGAYLVTLGWAFGLPIPTEIVSKFFNKQ